MKVSVEKLRREFGDTIALDDVSFEFGGGEICGFVGPNGAGKTTAMRIMATLDEPTSGDVKLEETSVVQDPEKVRSLIGFVPDELRAYRDTTVHQYVDFFARAYGLTGRKRMRIVSEVEDFTNISGIRNKQLHSLSKGMNQRVSLARALIHNPKVLILDEPAAGLDPRARLELLDLLKKLSQEGKAIFISSHILSELTEICHRVVIIEQGKILEQGQTQDLLSRHLTKLEYCLRSLSPQKDLLQDLAAIPEAENVRSSGVEVMFDVSGTEAHASQVLEQMIQKGHQVTHFQQVGVNLEDIFMNVTEGKVQ